MRARKDIFADATSAKRYAQKLFGVTETKKRSLKTPKKAFKKSKKAPSRKSSNPGVTKDGKPRKKLTIHRHFLIDIRRFAKELVWDDKEGHIIDGEVRNYQKGQVLVISLV